MQNMSNDKDFDRLFQEAFENWSFEPSEEGVHKMATKLNAMENSRLDELFLNKLKAARIAISKGALQRMQWLLFWRKHRALLSGSAILLLFSVAGLAWFSQTNRAPQPAASPFIQPESSTSLDPAEVPMGNTSSGNSSTPNQAAGVDEIIPNNAAQIEAIASDENAEAAAQVDERVNAEIAFDPATGSAPTTGASVVHENSSQPSQPEVQFADASESDPAIGARELSRLEPVDQASITQEDEPVLAELGSPSDGEGPNQDEEENNADSEITEGDIASDIPAAPWRSFKPLNWHYSATAGLDAGISGSAISLTPHVGFRVARLINPLVSVNSGISYLQRARINEALCYTDTVYLFGMEFQQREAHPVRMHFVEIPLFVSWQFAPGQFAQFGASASFAVLHEVEEVVQSYAAENTTGAHSSSVLRGNMNELASWDASVVLGYAVRFNHRWGAEIGSTWGLRDMTQDEHFQGSRSGTPNRNLWIHTKVSYQLNRIK